jgi:hypothetical protein
VASALGSLELALLCIITLSLALLETPVPRGWAFAALALVTVQTGALYSLHRGYQPATEESAALVHNAAEAIVVFAVPALTAGLLTVVFFHLARAYARARRRLEASLAAQAMGRDIPTGAGAATGAGSCISGSSIGDSATSPRAA